MRRTAYPHGLPVGAAVTTGAGRLPARWVIHTVGPNRHAGETDPACWPPATRPAWRRPPPSGRGRWPSRRSAPGPTAGAPGTWPQVAVSAVRASAHLEQLELVRFVLFGRTTLDAFAAALA